VQSPDTVGIATQSVRPTVAMSSVPSLTLRPFHPFPKNPHQFPLDTMLRGTHKGFERISKGIFFLFSLALQPNAGYGLLVHEVFVITHNDAPQSVGLLWTSDQLVAEKAWVLVWDILSRNWSGAPRDRIIGGTPSILSEVSFLCQKKGIPSEKNIVFCMFGGPSDVRPPALGSLEGPEGYHCLSVKNCDRMSRSCG
jgi:hypothetical protein